MTTNVGSEPIAYDAPEIVAEFGWGITELAKILVGCIETGDAAGVVCTIAQIESLVQADGIFTKGLVRALFGEHHVIRLLTLMGGHDEEGCPIDQWRSEFANRIMSSTDAYEARTGQEFKA